jgi:hypothetical protein
LRILVLEDAPSDAELIVRALKQSGFQCDITLVDTERDYTAALDPSLDIILADFNIRGFHAPDALAILRERNLDVPFIVVSGSIGEETAVAMLTAGASDYLLKDRLTRLGQAVQRAMEERRLRQAKREADEALILAEEQMRVAVEGSKVGIWEANVRTGAVRWSEMLEALHGLPPGSFRGTLEAVFECIEPADRAHVEKSIKTAMLKRSEKSITYRTKWPDGSIHWIDASGRMFYDGSGQPVRAAGIGIDVTERVRLEEQYRQAQKMEAVGQLAGGIAHDFNNLLTAIEGYAMLLAESLDHDSPHQAYLAEIQRAAERATGLTRQLLAFSRRQILEPRVLDLRESIRSIEPLLKRLIGEHIDVVVSAARDAGRVKADPGQIEQVILNLALNARDAMPDVGQLYLEVSAASLDHADARHGASIVPGQYTRLTIRDTGSGMDAATAGRIFEPFFTTKPKGKGTGLGLSTVYGIVKQSGGYIWVETEPGKGATFSVYLPRLDAPLEPTVRRQTAGSLEGSETVLVVEDEESVRSLVRKVLERRGYKVLIAGTPKEAFDLSAEHADISLIITDVVLPQMSGRTLADALISRNPSLRVLFMSGYTDDAIVDRGVLDEGIPFLQKPFTPEALARKTREVLS